MPWIERVRTEQPLDAAIDPTWARRLIDGFVGAPGITLAGKAITDTANITKGAFPLGVGRSGAANAGFSFPCDLSSQNAITVVFQFIQRARAGVEILIEHSTDQNTNAGSFIFFTNPGANTLIFAASTGGTSDQGTVPIPALNQVHTVAARLRFSSSTTAADDIKIFINGVAPAFTPTGTTNSTINFGNYSTYFLSRAASSLQTNGIVGMYAVLSGFSSDGELASLSANPWQLFQKERIFVPLAAGGNSTITQADGTSTASTLGGSASAVTTPTAAAGTSTGASIAASSTVAAGVTGAAGTSTASTLTGSAVNATAIAQADGTSTASTLTGTGLVAGASSITEAAGSSTTATLAGSSSAASTPTTAAGATTASSVAASSVAACVAIASAGASSAMTLTGSEVVPSAFTGPSRARIGAATLRKDINTITLRASRVRIGSPTP